MAIWRYLGATEPPNDATSHDSETVGVVLSIVDVLLPPNVASRQECFGFRRLATSFIFVASSCYAFPVAGSRLSSALYLPLLSAERPLRAISPATIADVRTWWADRSPLYLPATAIPVLDRWGDELRGEASPSFICWRPEGPGRSPVEATALIAWLRQHAKAGSGFSFNALRLEDQGGRSYPFYLPSYTGPITISGNKYVAAGKASPRLLLAAIRRDVRALLQAPPGHVVIELDLKSCHAATGHALSGEPQVALDLDAGFHQVVGDQLLREDRSFDAERRKSVGKGINNAMLFGAGPDKISEVATEQLGRRPRSIGLEQYNWWWGRYPRLAAFRDHVRDLVQQAQMARCGLVITAPSGRTSGFSRAQVRGEVNKGRSKPGPERYWKTVFSGCFRAVEGDVLDQTISNFVAAGTSGKLMLPLYDGLLVAAPAAEVEPVRRALLAAGERAAAAVGVPLLRPQLKDRPPPQGTAPARSPPDLLLF